MQNTSFKNSIKRPPRALLIPSHIREHRSFTAPCQLNEYFRAASACFLRQSSPQNCESQTGGIRDLVAQTEPTQGASNKTRGNSAYTPKEGNTVLQEEHPPWRTLTPWSITRKPPPTQAVQGFYHLFLFQFFQLMCMRCFYYSQWPKKADFHFAGCNMHGSKLKIKTIESRNRTIP